MKPKPSIIIKWSDTDGWHDIIPLDALRRSSGPAGIRHRVRNADESKPESEARCRVTVKTPTVVELDYRPFDTFNRPRDMLSGVAILKFESPDRTKLTDASWRSSAKKSPKKKSLRSFTFDLPPPAPYKRQAALKSKVEKLVQERPGQVKFRRTLKAAYENTCCFSGCPVDGALEGAHIDPYRNAASDNPTNGLLLRRDLHALFDAHVISVDPKTMKIHVSQLARAYAGYASLHLKQVGRPAPESYSPDLTALHRHWKLFLKNT